MTAEIAILNRAAVALAADSAVTIGNKKIFNSVNKLFSLSKRHPVGIMIYGNAEVMGIPWETVIKLYREYLGDLEHDTLDDYANDFLKFLQRDTRLFSKESQERCIQLRAYIECCAIRDRIVDRASKVLQTDDSLSDDVTRRISEEVAAEYLTGLESSPFLQGLDDSFQVFFEHEFAKTLLDTFENVLGKIPRSEKLQSLVFRVVSTFFSREIFVAPSGLVIAGFGRRDIFPSLKSLLIGEYVGGVLKWKPDRSQSISASFGSSIHPFAQSEMVYTFATGIDPEFDTVVQRAISSTQATFVESLIKLITPRLGNLQPEEVNQFTSDIRGEQSKLMNQLRTELLAFQRRTYIDPLHETVASLPGPELAAMAESLVNLTSFKRRMSMDKETVGGPIDVALITKGDGLIWIKRKHYFEGPLNPQFFANYNWRRHEEE